MKGLKTEFGRSAVQHLCCERRRHQLMLLSSDSHGQNVPVAIRVDCLSLFGEAAALCVRPALLIGLTARLSFPEFGRGDSFVQWACRGVLCQVELCECFNMSLAPTTGIVGRIASWAVYLGNPAAGVPPVRIA